MKSIYTLSFLFVLGLVSCGKDLNTNQIQSRLLGSWDIDHVEFKDKGSLIKKDVTGNWSDYRLTFYLDGTLDWIEKSKKDTLFGYWYINESYQYNSNTQNNEVVHKLELTVYDQMVENSRYLLWTDLAITNSKLKAQESDSKGKYFFKLLKID